MMHPSPWTGKVEVGIAGKTIFQGGERDIDHLFQDFGEGVSNTISKTQAEEYLRRALLLQKLLTKSITDLQSILEEYTAAEK